MERWRRICLSGITVALVALTAVSGVLGNHVGRHRSGVLIALVVATVVTAILAVCSELLARGSGEAAREAGEHLADELARQTYRRWRAEARAGGLKPSAPVQVSWRWAPRHSLPPGEVLRAPAEPNRSRVVSAPTSAMDAGRLLSGSVVDDLHDQVYDRLGAAELVILGPPGVGKTASMVLLLLKALEHRRRLPATARATCPVPVWVTLGGWNPRQQALSDYVVQTLRRDFRPRWWPRRTAGWARKLVAEGRVSLFLDGLDEMPSKARKLALLGIAGVQQQTEGLRVVVTSRDSAYNRARHTGQLEKPAAVTLGPVDLATAVSYLCSDHDSVLARRNWRRFGDQLVARPEHPVAITLRTPLLLTLVRQAYDGQRGRGDDPAELLTLTTQGEVTERVIGRFIDQRFPGDAEGVANWWRRRRRHRDLLLLGWAADRMGPGRDLLWWRIPAWLDHDPPRSSGPTWPGRPAAVLAGLLGIVTASFVFTWSWLGPGVQGLTFTAAAGAGILGAVAGGVSGSKRLHAVPSVTLPRRPGQRELARIARTVKILGWVILVVVFLTPGLIGKIVVLLGFVLLTAIGYTHLIDLDEAAGHEPDLFSIWRVSLPGTGAVTPIVAYRRDARRTLLATGVAGALTLAWVLWFAATMDWWSLSTIRNFLLAGLLGGGSAALGPAVLIQASPFLFSWRYRVWVRPIAVLQSAHRRQVLRQAGAIYQFRHAAVQEHLATWYRTTYPPKRAGNG
jgi:hypothetical protein